MSNPVRVRASPTKAFFVRMLTRDIDLADAILDLLDNCVDGVLRTLAQEDGDDGTDTDPKSVAAAVIPPLDGKEATPDEEPQPFAGFSADITAAPTVFEIKDNCGGIPEDVAIESAFMLGRPDLERDSELATVGMYGIGMKRAIFKIGESCEVRSRPRTGPYLVSISPDWLSDDDNWDLALISEDEEVGGDMGEDHGTTITVTGLHGGISRQFDAESSTFLADLEKTISQHYAVIIKKGFEVRLNGNPVKAANLSLLAPAEVGVSEAPKIEPYVFRGVFDDVEVELAVGFYRSLVTEEQLDDEVLQRSSRDNAGWTVICNDRVVIYNDKSSRTGWGTGGVPSYHNQFISISGLVSFRSENSFQLPLNTTKRGIDASSEVYMIVLDYMRTGMKKFTTFTNRWKRREGETGGEFKALQSQQLLSVPQAVKESRFTTIRKHTDRGSGQYYSPNLPEPPERETRRRICFHADQDEIEEVGEFLLGDPAADRPTVGRSCFEDALKRARY